MVYVHGSTSWRMCALPRTCRSASGVAFWSPTMFVFVCSRFCLHIHVFLLCMRMSRSFGVLSDQFGPGNVSAVQHVTVNIHCYTPENLSVSLPENHKRIKGNYRGPHIFVQFVHDASSKIWHTGYQVPGGWLALAPFLNGML